MRAQDQPVWRRFRRNLSLSLLGSACSLAIKLGQLALLVRVLRIDDFGRVLIVLNLFVFLEMLVGLRVSDVIFRLFLPLKELQATRALQGLLLLCLCISLATGLLVGGGVFILSPWLAERFYHNPELAPLFNIYGCTVLVSAFREVYEPLLRLHDRFASVIVPQVAGGLVTFAILAAHFASADGYDLKVIVAAFAVGVFVQSVPPLALALRLMQPTLAGLKVKPAARGLARHRHELLASLFHGNLSGYLKLAVNPGDIFLLGLFSTPAQVAVYGLARQLTAPLALLQTNVQTAVAPEVIALVARQKFVQLKRLIVRYVLSASVLGGLSAAGGMLLGHVFILWLSRPSYLPALPVFYVLLLIASLMLVVSVFRPLSIGLDLMRWYNLGLLLSAAIVFAFIAAGRLDALNMAFAQLAGALILRLLCNVPVWMRLSALAVNSQGRDEATAGGVRQ
jgi:O-antigen/teichoic acid export membrane protein